MINLPPFSSPVNPSTSLFPLLPYHLFPNSFISLLWSLRCWVNVWFFCHNIADSSHFSLITSGFLSGEHPAFSQLHFISTRLSFLHTAGLLPERVWDSFQFSVFCHFLPWDSCVVFWDGCGTTETTSSSSSLRSYSFLCRSFSLHRWVFVTFCLTKPNSCVSWLTEHHRCVSMYLFPILLFDTSLKHSSRPAETVLRVDTQWRRRQKHMWFHMHNKYLFWGFDYCLFS